MFGSQPRAIPSYVDTVIVGGGTAGAVLAGRLAERSDRSILVLEAGPDYGPRHGGGWPAPLLDARALPVQGHDWEYRSTSAHGLSGLALERARVIGGCSAHNGCAAIWGSRVDYDHWERLGNPGWGAEALQPLFRLANERLQVRRPAPGEITPWHQAVLDAAPGAGLPLIDDLNDLDGDIGIAPAPVNIVGGVRWNTAFAYLDPVRDRTNLHILGQVLVDRVILRGGRVAGLEAIGPEGRFRVETSQVVLCGGAYGSPAVLLRSGIGAPDDLRALGIPPVHALPGVGRNLHDHPAFTLQYAGTEVLVAALEAFRDAGNWLPEEQTIAKARSRRCVEAFDLHLYPVGGPAGPGSSSWTFSIPVAAMTPRSRGSLRLAGPGPDLPQIIDHGYLTDLEGHDLEVLLDGIEMARALTAQSPLATLIGAEIGPGATLDDRAALRQAVPSLSNHYYHPVGTCKMGPAGDPDAVVDAAGRVHGLEGLYVADAAIIPVIPRANTNLPCAVIGEKIAALLPD
jgi:choline dehydrogenase